MRFVVLGGLDKKGNKSDFGVFGIAPRLAFWVAFKVLDSV